MAHAFALVVGNRAFIELFTIAASGRSAGCNG